MEERWSYHLSEVRSGSCTYFHNAIRKHGIDTWVHEVLDVLTTREGAKHAEKLWIAHRKTFAYDLDNHGYNETRGGDGAIGYKHTETTLQVIREKRAKQIMPACSSEKAAKISASNHKTLSASPEACHKRALNVWKSRRANRVEATKPVLQYHDNDLIARHESIWAALQALGREQRLYNGSIKKCCEGIYKRAYGFSWRWAA